MACCWASLRQLAHRSAPPSWLACAASGLELHTVTACFSTDAAAAVSNEGSPGASTSAAREHLVDQYLSPSLMSKHGQLAVGKADIVRQFQRHAGDVGSSEVQVALLTRQIRSMEEHFKVHTRDIHNIRGLMAMLNRRRKLLEYLRRTEFERYTFTLQRLGLKDIYGKQTNKYAKVKGKRSG